MGAERTGSSLWAPAIMSLAVAALAVPVLLTWNLLFASGRTTPLVDIEYYRAGLEAVAAGRPLFDVLGYPPFALLAVAPLGWLPLRPAEEFWTATSMLAAILLAGLVVLLARRVPGRRADLPGPVGAATSAALAAFLLLSSDPMASQLLNGQISLLVVCLAFVDGCGLLPKRFQGSLIGIAGAIKLAPLIFVPYYVITGQRRQAVTSSLSFLSATTIGFLLFPGDSVTFWTHLGSTARFGDLTRADNVSLFGTLTRWIADPGVATYTWCASFIVVGCVALFHARRHLRRGERVQATLVVGTASVALSPVAWPHHQIWLVLVALWLLWTPRPLERALGLGLLAAYSLAWSRLYAPFRPDLLTFLVWEPRVLISVLLCLTGLPRDRPGEPSPDPAPAADVVAAS